MHWKTSPGPDQTTYTETQFAWLPCEDYQGNHYWLESVEFEFQSYRSRGGGFVRRLNGNPCSAGQATNTGLEGVFFLVLITFSILVAVGTTMILALAFVLAWLGWA